MLHDNTLRTIVQKGIQDILKTRRKMKIWIIIQITIIILSDFEQNEIELN